jgi:GAF domain-containing protein/anti-sigma regulatory factor (Ser/Thr protein kinase)
MSERTRKRTAKAGKRKPGKRDTLQRRLADALAREAASAEILASIRSSRETAQPVLDAIVRNLQRLFGTAFAAVLLAREGKVEIVAAAGKARFVEGMRAGGAMRLEDEELLVVRAMRRAQVLRLCPVIGNPDAPPKTERLARRTGFNSIIAAPILREGVAIGAVGTAKTEAVPFDDAQVALIQSFADQAVIAIENTRLFNETKEALEQQTATAEILKVISSSPTDVQPVFQTMGASVRRLCGAEVSVISRFDGELLQLAEVHVAEEGEEEARAMFPMRPDAETMSARAFRSRAVVHVADVLAEAAYALKHQARAGRWRGALAVPMIREGQVIGVIGVGREEPGLFSESQVELLKTFADQAVIAIENTRLFNETKEALEQQRATSDVLGVISSSPTDVAPVYGAILENVTRLCEANIAALFLYDGAFLTAVAHRNATPEFAKHLDALRVAPSRETPTRRAALEQSVVHVEDVLSDTSFSPSPAHIRERPRTVLSVPLLREAALVGVITIWRREARLFTDQQVALVKTFADQAVIAIENVRLFNETKEALEQQTATAEILKAISSSPTNIQPVSDTIAERAMVLCGGSFGLVARFDGELVHLTSICGFSREAMEVIRPLYPLKPGSDSVTARSIRDRVPAQIQDVLVDPEYAHKVVAREARYRSLLSVPLVRGGQVIGAITVGRPQPGAFPQKLVELLQTFADQAVIAIENARLFNETREALEQQTAIGEILRVISDSPTTVQPVLEAVAARAARICDATDARIFVVDGQGMRHAAGFGDVPMSVNVGETLPLDRGSAMGRAIVDRAPIHVDDMQAQPEDEYPYGRRVARQIGWRTVLAVPLLREGRSLGAVMLRRMEVRPFGDQQIALLKTFADQAAIAMENVRLFNETKEALEKQTATAEILGVISATPTDTQPVFEAIVRRATKLCEAAYANVFRFDGEQLHWVTSHGWPPDLLSSLQNAYPAKPDRSRAAGRVVLDKKPVHVEDTRSDLAYDRDLAGKLRYRRILAVPLVRSEEVVGVITVGWAEPGPIEPRHEELLKTFAAQAVIAIENVRLFNETKEALERQTATAEILGAISSSLTDTQPVFDIIAERAVALCSGEVSVVSRFDGASIQLAAIHGITREGVEALRKIFPLRLDTETLTARAFRARSVIHVADVQADRRYEQKATAVAAGWRSGLAVPMLRGTEVIGVIFVGRSTAGLFTESQVELLKTFADQAVIAIENVRLFNETKEALEQQTAISEVLRVISGSPADVQPVLEAVAERAAKICDAVDAQIFLREGDEMRHVARFGTMPIGVELGHARPLSRGWAAGRAVLEARAIHIEDLLAVPREEYPVSHELRDRAGHRTLLSVPLMRERRALGAISLRRMEVRPFTEKQIALLRTFADQAAIAIENVRLFNETHESLERQTATAEVLKTISRSTFDLSTVLQALLDNAARLGGAEQGVMLRPDAAGNYLPAFAFNWSEAVLERLRERPIRPGRDSTNGRVLLERRPIHIPDVLADPEYGRKDLVTIGGYRAVLAVPMLRDGEAIGLISLSSKSPFTEKQMEVVTSFADQAVIAIENVRLFNETKEALDQQKASADVLGVISSSIADTAPVFEKILDSCQRLFAGRNVGINVVGDDGQIHLGAYKGYGRAEFEARFPVPLSMESGSGAAILQRQVVHYPDCEAPEVPEYARLASRLTGNKSLLFAPMLWEGKGVGAVFVGRPVTGPFSEKDIALLRTFADQAAIAIQNAKLFREIQEKSAQLEVANKHKSDFLANMSHELRTPLNAIIGFSEALIDRMFGELNEKQAEYLKDIHESGRHLLSLINDILDLSKIEAGRMELDVSTFDLPSALSNAITLVRERAQRHAIDLALEVDKSLGAFSGDERKFKQIMLNLLSNAVKFTPDGGRIAVCARKDTTHVEISVQDTGIGIAPEDQAAVFEEFRQVGRDRLKKAEGTGLGLALTKRFVELHGGEIRLESTPGKGSTFTVSLPLRQ